jgi:protein-tyrosine-phosphatase
MAEALAKRLYGHRVYIDSVGVRASEVDGFAVAALDEIDIDVHRHHAKTFDDVDAASFELIVTLSPEAHHSALEFTRGTATEVEYWPMPDPSAVEGSREMRLDAYRHTRDQVLARLKARFGIPITPSV